MTVKIPHTVDALFLELVCTGSSRGSLVGLVVSKSHACYLLVGAGWDWVRIPPGLNVNGSAGDFSAMLSL